MHAATRDGETLTLAAVPHDPAPAEVMRWTWPLMGRARLDEYVITTVADACRAWGRSEEMATLLGHVAAELVGLVAAGPYVIVTAALSTTGATRSAISVADPTDVEDVPVSHVEAPASWGCHGSVGSEVVYLVIDWARRPAS
ncbi:hypothetical protein [Streptomyces fulvoviolaceus]|uniref:hypothetical protein n=1 Tax=Streptomyces fulvoviolaceus TaxID=285535 RepID=UPI0004CA5EA8|nr:hypothetical protein [Streptomyces fulvoviolaceus]